TFTGGKGGDGNSFNSTDGGDGARIYGYAALMGCSLQGGDSGDGPTPGKNSGYGLYAAETAVGLSHSVRDTVAVAGDVVGGGTAGKDVYVLGAHLLNHPAATRSLIIPAPLRAGQDAVVELA